MDRRISLIEAAIVSDPPVCYPIDKNDPDEVELEQCRIELNSLLYRAEAIASRLRARYQALKNDHLPAAGHIG